MRRLAIFDVVFEGGGAKGSAFVGALKALSERGHRTRRLIGTSAGAITATLTAAGYSPDELSKVVNEKLPDGKPRFAAFMDKPRAADFTEEQKDASDTIRALRAVHVPMLADRVILNLLLESPIYPQLFSFVECGGFFAGANFVEWLTEKLVAKGLGENETMATFFEKKQVDLSVVTSDTTAMQMLVLNHRTAPDVPLVWAVRMSMSIPFIWREVIWQESWGSYLGQPKTGNTFVDGGMLSNFPLRLIAEPDAPIMGDTDPAGALNLGLLLDGKLPITGLPAQPSRAQHDFRVVGRISALLDTMMDANDNEYILAHASEICRLPVQGVGTTEFNMSDQKLALLVNGGYQAMLDHLNTLHLAAPASA